MKAMVLAAGRGERMGALTRELPKPLLAIGATTLIERQLERLAAAGFREVVINLSYRGVQIRERLGSGRALGLTIRYSNEGEPPLETGGGIIRALPLLGGEPFLVVNADVVSDFEFASLRSIAPISTLVLVPNPDHNSRGDFGIDDAGNACHEPPLLTYAGIAVLDPALFAGFAAGRQALKPVLDAAITLKALRALRYDGFWIDVGTPERLDTAGRHVAAVASR
jgi:MurNAc alpha-1-phosphate uridylyltransferase